VLRTTDSKQLLRDICVKYVEENAKTHLATLGEANVDARLPYQRVTLRPVPVKLLNNYFQTCILVADIKPEILRYLRPPTDIIFRYLTDTHSEAISAEFSLYYHSFNLTPLLLLGLLHPQSDKVGRA